MAALKRLKTFYTICLFLAVLGITGLVVYTEIKRNPDDGFSRATTVTDIQSQGIESGYGDYEPIKVKDGALSWDVFAAVKEIERQEPDPNDSKLTQYWLEPQFTKEIKALDGQSVRLMGYMFPLDPTEEQSKFLFGPYPPTCAFHYHVNANQVLEATTENPIKFTWKPIAISGTLELVERDQFNTFYRLKGARLVKAY